jgi:hypothetical protein
MEHFHILLQNPFIRMSDAARRAAKLAWAAETPV